VVETIWANVTPGNYNIYVRVDPDGFVQETSESNNLASTALNLATDQLLLPLVNK
jgi:subtilase family serine protease